MEQLETLVGQVLDGRYALHRVIGAGGSAVVFRGEDLLLRRPVAIKLLRSEAASDSAAEGEAQAKQLAIQAEARRINRHAFLRESQAAARLSHPHIVMIYDVCPETDNPYIVMELVEGKQLSERIDALGVLPLHELLYITRCILQALEEAHEHGIIHRDIKAQNILLTQDGSVKITDFGIAEIDGSRSIQLEGKVLGTADTMSPEQASGEPVDARSDLYSLGVLMYQMATGHLPFEDDDPQTVAFLHRTEPPRYPSTLNPAIARGLEQIILTALEKEPGKRFPSASAMLAAVQRLEADPGHIFRRFSHRRLPITRRLSRHAVWLPVAGGFLTAALLFLLVFAFCGLLSQSKTVVLELPSYTNLYYTGEAALGLDPHVEVRLQFVLRTDLPEGSILAQHPAAGTCWKFDEEDDRETLWLSVVTHDPNQVTGQVFMKNCIDGRVVSSVGGLFEVLCTEDGEERRLTCRARGGLRRDDSRVLVGDRVTVGIAEDGHRGEIVITDVLPRNNWLIRPPLANLDAIYAVLAVADPAPMPETTDKLLAIMEHNRIDCTVVLTKSDLDEAAAERLATLYRTAGYTVFCVSAHRGEGIEALAAHIRAQLAGGHIAAFTGASGAGKSSLLNTLFPSLSLVTGEISKKIGRGKNTTRHTELYPVFGTAEGGFLADTPGFSMLDFARFDFMSWQDLPYAFREFVPFLGACRYSDCNHVKEQECAIRQAVEEGKIASSRYESYTSLYTVLRAKNAYAGEK